MTTEEYKYLSGMKALPLKALVCLVCLAGLLATCKGQPVPAADRILQDALHEASGGQKRILVIFHASWCGWCRKMDSSLADPSCRAFFDSQFVICHITVLESPDRRDRENPGGRGMMNRFGGSGKGIPYWVILDERGTRLADSRMPAGPGGALAGDGNCGCPAQPAEVAYFISVLKKTTPITAGQADAIARRFLRNASPVRMSLSPNRLNPLPMQY
ncbi:MAG TPA: thioredoxin family protein [Chitinophagaceae bacterium]|nr:thioredoxin family protein [Chitinophagaceae bacterium]